MFHNNSQPLVHLQRHPPLPKPDTQIPRGECGYLELQQGERHRCSCLGFFASHDELPTRCGCGHPAWYHEPQPLRHVSVDEHMAVVEELKRLRREFEKERAYRQEREAVWKGIEARLYENMKLMKVQFDDKVEECVDKTHAVKEKLITVEDATMELELKLEKIDLGRGLLSRSLTPVHESADEKKSPEISERMITDLPIRTERKYPESWSIKVIVVPHRSQPFAYNPDDVGYKRCASRNLHQELRFSTDDTESFTSAVETAFKNALKGRPWVPLTGYRPADDHFGRMALKQLPADLCSPVVWDHAFLDEHCIAHDKLQGDILYIALQHEDLKWDEIKYLPMAFGSDETCWAHNEELDGKLSYKSLDSELMYDYPEPPPYTMSRTHSDMDRTQTPLDILAAASLEPLATIQHQSQMSSERSMTAVSDRSMTAASERSFATTSATSYENDDEERHHKRPRPQPSQQSLQPNPGERPVVYLSSRSKRKVPVRQPRPAGESSSSKFPKLNNFLHRDHGKDKAQPPSAEASAS